MLTRTLCLIYQICQGCYSETVAFWFSGFDQICIAVEDLVVMDLSMILFMLLELNGVL